MLKSFSVNNELVVKSSVYPLVSLCNTSTKVTYDTNAVFYQPTVMCFTKIAVTSFQYMTQINKYQTRHMMEGLSQSTKYTCVYGAMTELMINTLLATVLSQINSSAI